MSSSGGAHTSTAESAGTASPATSSDVEPQPGPSVVVPGAVSDPTQPTTQPSTQETEAAQPTSNALKPEPDSTHSTTANAVTKPAPPTTSIGAVKVVSTEEAPATVADSPVATRAFSAATATQALSTEAFIAAATPAATTQLATPAVGVVGFLNAIVTNLLNPFLAPAPDTSEPLTPVMWAVLAWVRRNIFNQSPTIAYNPTTTVQTGQTVTGKIGATDPEGDALKYTVTKGPQHGTLTIDQATGNFTYTPDDINYTAAQLDTFTVSVSDGKVNLLSLFTPHSDQTTIGVTALNPTVERVILNLPDGITNPNRPRFSGDGKSLYFSATPVAGGRQEVYQIGIDGTDLQCLTCGVTTSITGDLQKPLPFEDGSGRVLIRITTGADKYTYVIFEDGVAGKQLVPLTTPDSPTFVVDRQREVKVSPDGTHLLFSRLELGTNGYVAIVPVVGALVRTANGYVVDDARVVAPYGEGKSWTPDGKSVIIQGGQYDAGNVDAIKVDLATGNITRQTAGLDYEENVFESPNGQWIVAGSTRGLDALTPMSRIVRPAFLPAYIVGPVYLAYASPVNVSNQAWVVAIDDELKRETVSH